MTETSSASGSSMNTSTTNQARLVIVGATGMVGGYALRYALEHAAVGTVTAIGRRKLGMIPKFPVLGLGYMFTAGPTPTIVSIIRP